MNYITYNDYMRKLHFFFVFLGPLVDFKIRFANMCMCIHTNGSLNFGHIMRAILAG
jgi:hypothetical protein